MFRSFSGYKSQVEDLTLLVVAEFNEWKVMAYAPGTTIHGTRQFTEAKAKEHALAVAESYITEHRHHDASPLRELQWQPTGDEDWLVWRG